MDVHIIWEYISNYGCENLKKVVLIDMTAKMMAEPEENWPHTIFDSYTRADGMAYLEQCAQNWDSCADEFVPAMFSDGPCKDEIPWVLDMAKRNTPHVMVNMWLTIIQKDYRDMLNDIKVSCLYTYGARKSLYFLSKRPGGLLLIFHRALIYNKIVGKFISEARIEISKSWSGVKIHCLNEKKYDKIKEQCAWKKRKH